MKTTIYAFRCCFSCGRSFLLSYCTTIFRHHRKKADLFKNYPEGVRIHRKKHGFFTTTHFNNQFFATDMSTNMKKIMLEIEQQPWQYLGRGYYYFMPTDELYIRENGKLSAVDYKEVNIIENFEKLRFASFFKCSLSSVTMTLEEYQKQSLSPDREQKV